MLRGHVTADATTFTVHCHDRIFKQVTVVDNDGRALFRCEGQSYGSSWSWRRKVYDGTGQYLFDLRHNNIDIKNGWVVETPMKQKVCSLDFTSFWTKGPAAITATVRTQPGENVVVKTHPQDRSALTTAIRVDGISFASITKLEDNDAVHMEGRDRSVWRINVAPGVDLSLHDSLRVLLSPTYRDYGLSLTSAKSLFIIPGMSIVWAQSLILNIVHVTEILYINPIYRQDPQCSSPFSFQASYRLWTNPRLLNFPRVQKYNEKREHLGVFIFLRLVKVVIYYCLAAYVLPAIYSETIVELLPEDIEQPALFTRLGEVTAREFLVRSYTAVEWIWKTVAYFDGANAVLACLSVLSGFDRPEDWPNLFSSPVEACGLRNFWSRFWHQLAVRPFKGYGLFISSRLGLQPDSWPSKIFVAFTIFLVSGRLGRPPGAKNKRKGHSATCPKAANKSVQSNDIGTLKDMQADTPDVEDQQTIPPESKPLQHQYQEIRPQEQAQEQPRTVPLEHHPASGPLQPAQHGAHLFTDENSTNFVDQPIDWKTRLHPFSHILAGSWDWPQPNAPYQPR
ncbi:hypothetical protein E8E14_007345 [Neopestalotiopsis sp. 37M]|nr:hypothetical protein E8E14_007345 [Neopestalotiopsis sp. 37M]